MGIEYVGAGVGAGAEAGARLGFGPAHLKALVELDIYLSTYPDGFGEERFEWCAAQGEGGNT